MHQPGGQRSLLGGDDPADSGPCNAGRGAARIVAIARKQLDQQVAERIAIFAEIFGMPVAIAQLGGLGGIGQRIFHLA